MANKIIDPQLAEALREISQSISRKGKCWDNAPMESWFGHAKDEIPLSG